MFRWFALVVLAGALSLSAFHRRRARDWGGAIRRRDESAGLVLGRLLVALPLFGGVLLYIVHPPSMAWASFAAPTWLRWVGVALGLAAVPAVHWVLGDLGSNVSETVLTKKRQELVTSGPYRWVRHPLYTTGIALFTALGLIAANGFILGCALVALAAIRLVVVPREERELVARFGPRYERYRRRTGALIPHFGGGR